MNFSLLSIFHKTVESHLTPLVGSCKCFNELPYELMMLLMMATTAASEIVGSISISGLPYSFSIAWYLNERVTKGWASFNVHSPMIQRRRSILIGYILLLFNLVPSLQSLHGYNRFACQRYLPRCQLYFLGYDVNTTARNATNGLGIKCVACVYHWLMWTIVYASCTEKSSCDAASIPIAHGGLRLEVVDMECIRKDTKTENSLSASMVGKVPRYVPTYKKVIS